VGPLTLSSGVWSFSYDGKDSVGNSLSNGIYLLVLESVQNGQTTKVKFEVTVIGGNAPGMFNLVVWPNPVRSAQDQVTIHWQSSTPADEVLVYNLAGQLVCSLGTFPSPVVWDLRTGSGSSIADGIYWIGVRVPGQHRPHFVKLMVAR